MEFYSVLSIILLFALAYANGSNDISKSIATLAGAGVTSIDKAVAWGTFWMVVGGLSGVYWGLAIIKNLTQNIYTTTDVLPAEMAISIAIAPMIWVFLSTYKKWPVSTTHAIVGGLIGSGVIVLGIDGVAWGKVGAKIALPLLISPVVSILLAILFTSSLKKILNKMNKYQICLSPLPRLVPVTANAQNMQTVDMQIEQEGCVVCEQGNSQSIGSMVIPISEDVLHWFTSGLLSFARGLNDTPKLIAVVLPLTIATGAAIDTYFFVIAALAMGAGGFISGKRITKVLGFGITDMDHQQGFIANLISSFLVIGASKFGMPVSTTHVSASAIMGAGLAEKRKLQKNTVISMLLAWLVTVPSSALIAVLCYLFLHAVYQ